MTRSIRAALVAGVALTAFAPSASAADYVKNRVIVKYKSGATAESKGLAKTLAGVTGTVGNVAGLGAQVLTVTGDAKAAAAKLNRNAAVLYAEPDYIYKTMSVPNDPQFGQLYGINNANDADLDGPEGWDTAFGAGAFPASGGAKVGIVDTGIDQNHEDLAGKTVNCGGVKSFGLLGLIGGDPTIVAGKCADDNDHGTHVAGTVAAVANNGKGVAGVAPNAPLAICKALSAQGSGSTTGIANCIDWLRGQGVKVISMSLGGGSATVMQQAVQRAAAAGIVIVAAAGNDGNTTTSYPAGYPEVISVAATDSNDQKASFSNTNADVEIAAAGVDVLSTKRGGGYVAFSGTSMATPHVAGVASLIAFTHPSWTAAQIRSRLNTAVDDLGAPGRDTSFGFGRTNLQKAVAP